jgi:hypothetical protein
MHTCVYAHTFAPRPHTQAPSIDAVEGLFQFLLEKSYPFAVKELKEVQAYANANGWVDV